MELDALRALAAINLMLFHFTHVYCVKYGYTSPLGFEYPYGKYGVQLFFMLSGYVNALTLLSKGQPLDFLAARTIRILPSYLLVIGLNLVLILCLPLSGDGGYTLSQVLANLTLVPNLWGYECLEPVTWTLQVEVLFYGALLLMYGSGGFRRPLRTLSWYLAVCLCGSWFLDGITAELSGTPAATFCERLRELLLLPYLPLFAIGILLYRIRSGSGRVGLNLAGIVAAASVFHAIDHRDFNPAATVLFTALLAGSAYGRIPLLRVRPLVFISSISYSLYLLHNNLGTVFIYQLNHWGVPSVVCFVMAFPFVIGVAALATYAVERPLSQRLQAAWKKFRHSPARIRTPAATPGLVPTLE